MKCWSCAEEYDDSKDTCPQCGAPKEKEEHKRSHHKQVPKDK